MNNGSDDILARLPELQPAPALKNQIDDSIREHRTEKPSEWERFLERLPEHRPSASLKLRIDALIAEEPKPDALSAAIADLPVTTPPEELEYSIARRKLVAAKPEPARGKIFRLVPWVAAAAACVVFAFVWTRFSDSSSSVSTVAYIPTAQTVPDLVKTSEFEVAASHVQYAPQRVGRYLVYTTVSDEIHALGDDSRTWKFRPDQRLWTRPVADHSGYYFIDALHQLSALDVEDQKLRWKVTIPPVAVDAKIFLADQVIWIHTLESAVLRLSTRDGKVLSNEKIEFAGPARFAVDGATLWLVDEWTGAAKAFDIDSGVLKGNGDLTLAAPELQAGPYFVEGKIISSSADGRIEARNYDGTVIWSVPGEGLAHRPMGLAGKIVIAGFDGTFRRIDAESGAVSWESKIEPAANKVFEPHVILEKDKLYVATGGKRIEVIDLQGGRVEDSLEPAIQSEGISELIYDAVNGLMILDSSGSLYRYRLS